MFDIFTTTHSEQRAVLYEGSEEISVKTAKLMLSRLYTNYYNEIERERVVYVLTKLGYLTSDNVKIILKIVTTYSIEPMKLFVKLMHESMN
ncbi:hypothetical protein [Aeromonas veronii]|uniref:hypothetical protein n=1 Tax=Aeromonas veronii TaxID=654 RepID=UPI003D1DDF47